MNKHDNVNHPKHYTTGKIEVIEFLEDQKLEPHEWNAVKYICRARHKGNQVEDLKKAIWYLNRKIESLQQMKQTIPGSAFTKQEIEQAFKHNDVTNFIAKDQL